MPRSRDINSIFCKWIYKIKCTSDESIVRYKTQTVDPGFSQEYGLNYDETFCLVTKITIIQVPTVLAVNKYWILWQMDINNAFLHGELDWEFYLNQPNGFENEVGVISLYMRSLKKLPLDAARRTLRYIKQYHHTRRSSIGYVFKLSSRTIFCVGKDNQQYHCLLEK